MITQFLYSFSFKPTDVVQRDLEDIWKKHLDMDLPFSSQPEAVVLAREEVCHRHSDRNFITDIRVDCEKKSRPVWRSE